MAADGRRTARAIAGAARLGNAPARLLDSAGHRWCLVSDEDPDEHEVCIRCGAQRNNKGPLAERATITGGWPRKDCDGE